MWRVPEPWPCYCRSPLTPTSIRTSIRQLQLHPSPALMFFTKQSPLLTLPLRAKSSSSLFISKALEPCLSLLYPGPIRCPSRIHPEDWKGIFRLGTFCWCPATVHDRALKEQNLDIQDANGRLGLTVYAHLQGGTQRKTPEARWPASLAKSLPEEITVSTENKAAVEKKP